MAPAGRHGVGRDAARQRRILSPEFTPLDRLVRSEIANRGPIPYTEVVDLALYHPEHGFYADAGGRAGRRGDFITSPEVGPLFGALVARVLDAEWDRLGQPAQFDVVDAGAGPGTLARTVLAAHPRCREAMRYVAVEASAAQRAAHPDEIESSAAMPEEISGVVIANELLDNLAFSPAVRIDGIAHDALVDDVGGRLVPIAGSPVEVADDAVVLQEAAGEWVRSTLGRLEGRLFVIDYARSASAEVEVRTYRAHEHGGDPLAALGTQDITVDVDIPQLAARSAAPHRVSTQADWLRGNGIDELVDEGRRIWEERAHLGDLQAIKARSRITEAEALLDPTGLGAFTVLEWTKPAND